MANTLIPKNLDNPDYLLPVCRNCTIKYHPVRPEGSSTPKWYFLGEAPGITEDVEGKPFVGESGRLLRRMISESGLDTDRIRMFNSTACLPTDERGFNRNPESEESTACFNTFAKVDIIKSNPEIIIAVGRGAFLTMFPDMNRLSMKEIIQVTGLKFEGIPVRAIYHTSYIERTGGVTSSVYGPSVAILKELREDINDVQVIRADRQRIICFPHEFEQYASLFTSEDTVALDFESTVDSPYDSRFRLGILGLSNSKASIAVVFESPDIVLPITETFKVLLKEVLNRRILVFNASFEMPTVLRFFGIDIADKIHDLMQSCRALNLSGGLKNICRLNIQAPAWSATLDKWTSTIPEAAEYLYKKRKQQVGIINYLATSKSILATIAFIKELIREASFGEILTDKEKDHQQKLLEILGVFLSVNDLIQAIPNTNPIRYDCYYAQKLSDKIVSKNYLLDYTDIPIEVVGPYNLDDTAYTFDLDTFVQRKLEEKKCTEAASLYDEHVRLSVELTSAGITWDDTKAEEILGLYNTKALQSLKELILHPLLAPQLSLTDAQKLEIYSSVDELALLKYFNPRSSHKTTREKFSNALVTKDVKKALILYLLKSDADLMIRIKESSNLLTEYSTLMSYLSEDEKEQLAKYKLFSDAVVNGTLSNPSNSELKIIRKATNYELEGINQECFEFFFDLFTKIIGINPNDKSTWTPEFYLLYYCRLFKKISKGRSAYIEGKCGRGQVKIVDRVALQEERMPLRLRDYSVGDHLESNEVYILQPEYKATDAITKRWKSFIHCLAGETKVRLMDGRNLQIDELYKEYTEGKINYVVSVKEDGSYICENITKVQLSGYVSEVAKLTLDTDEVIISTINHRYRTKLGEDKEVKDLIEGESLHGVYIEEKKAHGTYYDSIYDKSLGWIYLHSLSDDFNKRYNLLRDMSEDEFGRNRSWVRHHCDFNSKNNNPDNIKRYGWITHQKIHSKSQENTWKTIKLKLEKDPEYAKEFHRKRSINGKNSFTNYWNDPAFRLRHVERNRLKLINIHSNKNKSVSTYGKVFSLFTKIDKNNYSYITEIEYDKSRLIINSQSYPAAKKIKELIGNEDWSYCVQYIKEQNWRISSTRYENHKVKKVEILTLDIPIPVYDLSVKSSTPYFVLSSGIVSHNTIPWSSELREIHISRFLKGILCHFDYCLHKETKIVLSDGKSIKSISDLLNDYRKGLLNTVLSKNNKTGEFESKPVLDVFETTYEKELLELKFDSGLIIRCTPTHKFKLKGKEEWIYAQDIIEESELEDINSEVECPYCGKLYKQITKGHLSTHGQSSTNCIESKLTSYIKSYSHINKELSEDHKKAISQSSYRRWEDPLEREKQSQRGINRYSIKEERVRQSELTKKQWTNEETRKLMSQKISDSWEGRSQVYTSGTCGFHESPKAGKIYYRSSYEKKAYEILDSDPEVDKYEVEPFRLTCIDSDGTRRGYKPDILVYYIDKDRLLVEVKAKWAVSEFKNSYKYVAALSYCKSMKIDFTIITEEELFSEVNI